jgi:hypothetical protein
MTYGLRRRASLVVLTRLDPIYVRRVYSCTRYRCGTVGRPWGGSSPRLEAVLIRLIWLVPAFALATAAQPLAAQESREQRPQMPVTFTPPAGLCRLWITGVPASQQPAPTDCASAIKNRPSNAAVVFGPKRRSESSEMEPFTRRAGSPNTPQFAPNALAPKHRDEVREHPADTTAKPPPRKPEKPQ